MTTSLYYADPALRASGVVAAVCDGENPSVILEATIFHPQGGGQRADQGWIGESRVLHVARDSGDIHHYVDALDGMSVGDEVTMLVDEEPRRLHSRLHTAGHLIAGLAAEIEPGLKPIAGHHWPGEARVDFRGTLQNPDRFKPELESRLDAVIASDLEVVTTDGSVPPRVVRIGGYNAVPCGGTHSTRLGEIGSIRIRGIKRRKDRLRVSYDVGTAPSIPFFA